LILVGGIAQSI